MQPTLRSQSDVRYPALFANQSQTGSPDRLRYPLLFPSTTDASVFGNANDCHDEKGLFCEGGSSGGSALDRAANAHDRMRSEIKAKSKPTGGIGPQASVYSAEKRGKEYGYAKKVSFYQCKDVDQANEINAQMAELSDDSGLVLDRVFVFKETGSKEAPANSNAYHQGSTKTIGFKNGVTAQYCAKNAPYPPGQQEANAKWFFDYANKMEHEHETGQREKVDPTLIKAFRKQGKEALRFKDYSAFTVPGNGVRNPVVDHEFAHALVSRAEEAGWKIDTPTSTRVRGRINDFGARCRESAEVTKFSVYAVTGKNVGWIENGEPIAETYAYWKSGGLVPDDIAKGLRRLETYRGPWTGT
jgi:hypothetical protein